MSLTSNPDEPNSKPDFLVKVRDKRLKAREERKAVFDRTYQDEIDVQKSKKKQQFKKTYPMCMEYYEPHSVAIFALVSKEI